MTFLYYIPLYLRSHLIYKFLISNCNITYYGETECHFKVRAGEHISTFPLTAKRVNNNKQSFVKDYTTFSLVMYVHLMILLSWIMSHTSLNVWLKNLYLLKKRSKNLLFQVKSLICFGRINLPIIIPKHSLGGVLRKSNGCLL